MFVTAGLVQVTVCCRTCRSEPVQFLLQPAPVIYLKFCPRHSINIAVFLCAVSYLCDYFYLKSHSVQNKE